MRTNRAFAFASLACAAASIAGCTPAAVPLGHVGNASPALAQLLAPGSAVVLLDGATCDTTIGERIADLRDSTTRLSSTPFGKAPSFWKVGATYMQLGASAAQAYLAVELVNGPAANRWIRIPGGGPMKCLVPASDEIVRVAKLVGQKLAFAPTAPACTRIEIQGAGASSLVTDAEPDATVTFGAMRIDAGGRPWLDAGSSATRVRGDVAASCFAAPSVEAKRTPLALTRTPLGRCTRGDDEGKEHFECRSTVGLWEGTATDSEVSLRFVRRTLGPLHFTGGTPVDGRRYARTVVSVATGKPADARTRAVADAIQRSAATALAGGDGGIRVAPPGDPAVGRRIDIDSTTVQIGELARRQVPASSQYQDGTRTVPNPELPKAREALEKARAAVEKAHREHEEAVRQFERDKALAAQAKETCLQGCALNTNPNMANICRTGCDAGKTIADVLMKGPSDADISRAESEAESAKDRLDSTPPTVTEPVMKTWSYEKTVFSRSASTTLRVTVSPTKGDATRFEIPLVQSWEDYEVAADGAHNVAGHEAARGPIERPDALVPWLADRAAEALAKKLTAVLDQAELAEAKQALEGGDRKAKAGFEDVDGKAFDVAGRRLVEPVQRGRSTLAANTDGPLPADGVALDDATCLLAIAVADGDDATSLAIASGDGAFADRRGKRFASVEACGADVRDAAKKVTLTLRSTTAAQVRWGLYRTRATAPTASK
jgi:hypothetical protein